MGARITPWEYDKEQLKDGIEQAQWGCLIAALRFGIPNETILHIAQKVRNMPKPLYFGCSYFEASKEFIEAIPSLPLTEEDLKNLRYTKNELEGIYHDKAYDGGIKFVEIAYIVYLLVAEVRVEKIARMFKVEESYVQNIQDRFKQQVPDTYSQEKFIRLFWEETIYITSFQIGEKLGRLQVNRRCIINLLKNTMLPLDALANIFSIPVDVIVSIMRSVGMKKREDMPVYQEEEEPDDDENSGESTAESTPSTSEDD